MKRTLKKRILPLLCAGLLLCTPHTIAYATAGGIESTMTPTAETPPPPAETPPPPVVTPPATTPPAVIPPPVATPPVVVPPVATPPAATPPVATPPVVVPPPATTPPAATPPAATPPVATPPPGKAPVAENAGQPSYGIEIAWGKLEFDYAPLWNPDTHCYEGWKSTENPITVTNTAPGGAPVQVTLTFLPIGGTGPTVIFAPPENDPHPEDFTFSNGQVTFRLPRAVSGTSATINLSLSCKDATGLNTQQYSQVGSIKTVITPLTKPSPLIRPAEKPTGPALPPPTGPAPLPTLPARPKPPFVIRPAEKPAEPAQSPPTGPVRPGLPAEAEQPPAAEVQPPEAVKPEQESTPGAMPPPKQNSKQEAKTAPHTQSGASPQEEPQ